MDLIKIAGLALLGFAALVESAYLDLS
jgi:hypothetical protein